MRYYVGEGVEVRIAEINSKSKIINLTIQDYIVVFTIEINSTFCTIPYYAISLAIEGFVCEISWIIDACSV